MESKKISFVLVVFGKQQMNFKDLDSWYDYYKQFSEIFGSGDNIDDSKIKVYSVELTPIINVKPQENG